MSTGFPSHFGVIGADARRYILVQENILTRCKFRGKPIHTTCALFMRKYSPDRILIGVYRYKIVSVFDEKIHYTVQAGSSNPGIFTEYRFKCGTSVCRSVFFKEAWVRVSASGRVNGIAFRNFFDNVDLATIADSIQGFAAEFSKSQPIWSRARPHWFKPFAPKNVFYYDEKMHCEECAQSFKSALAEGLQETLPELACLKFPAKLILEFVEASELIRLNRLSSSKN